VNQLKTLTVSREFHGRSWRVTDKDYWTFTAHPFATKRQAQAFADLLNDRPDLWQKPWRSR